MTRKFVVSSKPLRDLFDPEHVDWLMVLRDEVLRLREDHRLAGES